MRNISSFRSLNLLAALSSKLTNETLLVSENWNIYKEHAKYFNHQNDEMCYRNSLQNHLQLAIQQLSARIFLPTVIDTFVVFFTICV